MARCKRCRHYFEYQQLCNVDYGDRRGSALWCGPCVFRWLKAAGYDNWTGTPPEIPGQAPLFDPASTDTEES